MKFVYQAIDKNKIKLNGTFEALEKDQVIDYLLSQNLTIISVKRSSNIIFDTIKSITALFKTTQLIEFTTEMRLLLSTGISASEAVLLLSYANSGKSSYPFVSQIASDMSRGVPMSLSLAQFPSVFTPVYISMIESGERSKKLAQIFAILENQVKTAQESNKKIFTTLIYPIFLFLALGLLMFFLSVFFLPSLVALYEDLNIVLPASTTFLIQVAKFLSASWQLIVIIALVGLVIFFQTYTTKSGRLKIDEIMLKIPFFSQVLIASAVQEIAMTMSIMLGAGLSLEESLDNASRAVPNRYYAKKLNEIKKNYSSEKSLSSLFVQRSLFPAIFTQMLMIGEKSGQIQEVMSKIADYYQNEADTYLRSFTGVIQPIVITVTAVFIGVLILALFQPIYSIIGTLN